MLLKSLDGIYGVGVQAIAWARNNFAIQPTSRCVIQYVAIQRIDRFYIFYLLRHRLLAKVGIVNTRRSFIPLAGFIAELRYVLRY